MKMRLLFWHKWRNLKIVLIYETVPYFGALFQCGEEGRGLFSWCAARKRRRDLFGQKEISFLTGITVFENSPKLSQLPKRKGLKRPQSNSIFPKPQKTVCHFLCHLCTASVSKLRGWNFACGLHSWVMRALVLGRSRPASAASEAVSWYVLFGVSKNHRRKHFLRSWLKSKVAKRPRFCGTGWPQIWPPRTSEAIRGQK